MKFHYKTHVYTYFYTYVNVSLKKWCTAYLESETACVTMSTCSCFDSWWFCAWHHACRNLSSKTCYPEAQKDSVGWCKQLTVHRGFTKGTRFMWSSSGIILRTFRGFFKGEELFDKRWVKKSNKCLCKGKQVRRNSRLRHFLYEYVNIKHKRNQ